MYCAHKFVSTLKYVSNGIIPTYFGLCYNVYTDDIVLVVVVGKIIKMQKIIIKKKKTKLTMWTDIKCVDMNKTNNNTNFVDVKCMKRDFELFAGQRDNKNVTQMDVLLFYALMTSKYLQKSFYHID